MIRDHQLMLAVAKISSKEICYYNFKNTHNVGLAATIPLFQWGEEFDIMEDTIRDTEWNYICWLIEHNLGDAEMKRYILILDRHYRKTDMSLHTFEEYLVHLSWQEKAEALCELKGVTI